MNPTLDHTSDERRARRQVADEGERILALAHPGEQGELVLNEERKGK